MKKALLAILGCGVICALPACTSALTDPRASASLDTSSAERPEVATGSNIVRRDKNAQASVVKQLDKDSIEIRRAPTNIGSGS